jgi:hypothetical protein
MLETPRIICSDCGGEMYKRPQVRGVLWSRFIEPSPAVKRHISTLSEQRGAYLERHHD